MNTLLRGTFLPCDLLSEKNKLLLVPLTYGTKKKLSIFFTRGI